ncbi:MAG: hypothetical protein RL660_1054 [Bacteroidota bacterium]|jgi:pimeloyl-ACP methyl ester carboxylesterase
MMNRLLFTLLCCLLSATIFGQQVGHTTVTFNDAARTGGFGSGGGPGRQMQTEIYYNAATAGVDVPMVKVGGNAAPVIVFGHGFLMGWDSYSWLWDSLVREGYVVALPRTEGGITPNHIDFGEDLKQVASKLVALNSVNTSIFFNNLSGKAAIGGHSMGGGASFIAGAGNVAIACLFNFAAAQTSNNSASTGAKSVQVPTLVFAGGNDCVAPPATHAKLIYDSINEITCRWFININDGLHCQFNDLNLTCSAGQIGCPTSPVTREQQLSKVLRHLRPFLKHYLQNDVPSFSTFSTAYNNATDVVKESSCLVASNTEVAGNSTKLYPNPCTNYIVAPRAGLLRIFTTTGVLMQSQQVQQGQQIDVSKLPIQCYVVRIGELAYSVVKQ